MRLSTRTLTAVACGILLGSAACNDEMLLPPQNEPADAMFARYVAFGNSITAGFQSGGIWDTVQSVAYPVLLARAMATNMYSPLMASPGCPAPYDTVFTQHRRPGPPCALRRLPGVPPPYLTNLGLPGAEILETMTYSDPSIIPSATDAYRTFLLGGRTELALARDAQPTFVSVWLGNNDVLGSVLDTDSAGKPSLVTPPATFATRFQNFMDSLDAMGSIVGGVVVGVANVTAIPYASQGQAYFAAKAAGALPVTFIVGPNCAPSALGGKGDSVLVPFPFGGTKLARASAGIVDTLLCTEEQTVQPAELVNLVTAVTGYNTTIQAEAAARGWAYLDPNPTFDSLRTDPAAVRPFPVFVVDPPPPGPPLFPAPCTANPFGTAFSCDAIHPSTTTQRLVARKVREAINTHYGTTLPAIP